MSASFPVNLAQVSDSGTYERLCQDFSGFHHFTGGVDLIQMQGEQTAKIKQQIKILDKTSDLG